MATQNGSLQHSQPFTQEHPIIIDDQDDDQAPSTSSSSSVGDDRTKSGLVYSATMTLHSNPANFEHPESPDRIIEIFRLLNQQGCVRAMKRIRCREAKMEEVTMVHDRGVWDGLERTAGFSREILRAQVPMLDSGSSLYINENSAMCARLSCGGTIELCDAIASRSIRNGFAIVRPPGHHAEPETGMGFCFYNNVAVATRHLQQKYREGPNKIKKVLILDWDVHHGNGTQKTFEHDSDVLYISLHRHENGEFYPGGPYGGQLSVGSGEGEGKSINIAWPTPGMGDGDYLYAFQHIVMPIATEFKPDFVIISAGFDAAEGDPIGHNLVTPYGYAHMTYMLAALAEGRLAVILEGGYDPKVIAQCALEVTKIILNNPPPPLPTKTIASPLGAATTHNVAKIHSRYWKSLKIHQVESSDAATGVDKLPLAELIRTHRTYKIATQYQFDTLPIRDKVDDHFPGQVMCSFGILNQFDTIVLFVHDMGNLRFERFEESDSTDQEVAYLVESSSRIYDWAKKQNYGIVDINVFIQLPTENGPTRRSATVKQIKRKEDHRPTELVTYVWDNLISLSDAKKIILIGHGTATCALVDLIEKRSQSIEQGKIRAIIQVLGNNQIPRLSGDSKFLRKWYWNHSKVLVPTDHPHFAFSQDEKPQRRLGKVEKSNEKRAIRILQSSLDEIFRFAQSKLA